MMMMRMRMMMRIFFYFRPDLEQLYDEYSALSTEELPNHDVPMMFISFPSAKDPSWHETNPGNH